MPDRVESLLAEMNIFSQFDALRRLHAMLRSDGESPALLGALVRGYANLGIMTEYHWHAANKVFKARALLYAQRMLARDEKSPVAKWHRAYAAALTGLHAWALADLDEADQAWQAMAENDRPPRPAWVGLVGPFCRYDLNTLAQPAKDGGCKELAALLRFVAMEQAGGSAWDLKVTVASLQTIPECYRIYDGLRECINARAVHSVTSEAGTLIGKTLYGRVKSMPGLPGQARQIVNKLAPAGGLLGALFGNEPSAGEDEYLVRRQLIDALLESGESSAPQTGGAEPAAADTGEPSWTALGVLIRELSFKQVCWQLNWNPGEKSLGAATPLVEGHPCRVYLETIPAARKHQDDGRILVSGR